MSDEITEPPADVVTGRMSGRIEIVGRVSGRRRWTVEQKLAILRDAFGPDGLVRAAVERHEIGNGAIYTWRRQAMSGALSGVPARPQTAFAEVRVSDPPVMLSAPPSRWQRTPGPRGISASSCRRVCDWRSMARSTPRRYRA
ncbi:transposase [Sphingomonas faeni]|uniref:transposase n=1 Tax=Sphingomonas faeni TaxID=185950 RepID=UPI00278708B1|nr:transposase [Sphingomonas faeni]MDQ0838847.1 transposase [Sphingomonas faeni]